MEIQPKQLKQIQTIMSSRTSDREQRLDFISTHLGREVATTKELSSIEADELIYFLNTGKKSNANWAFFDKDKFVSKRKYLWSLLHQAQWVVKNERHHEVPDLNRLSDFIKSSRSPVQKPLKQWKVDDWSKMIFVFENIVKGIYK